MRNLNPPPLSIEYEIAEIADWVELRVASTREAFSRGDIQMALSREGHDDPAALSLEAWNELERRSRLCGEAWPLSIRGLSLRSKPGPTSLLHYFLCTLSLGVEVEYIGRRLFEYCVADVVKALTGGNVLRLGSPRSPGLPPNLDEAVDVYVRLSLEEKRKALESDDNDFGLDIVSWKSFQDRRGAFLQFIGQCATGKHWYEEDKHKELQIDSWSEHVGWAVKPVRFFAVPFVVQPHRWRRAALDGGLILDRPRLLELHAQQRLRPRLTAAVYDYCRSLYAENAA